MEHGQNTTSSKPHGRDKHEYDVYFTELVTAEISGVTADTPEKAIIRARTEVYDPQEIFCRRFPSSGKKPEIRGFNWAQDTVNYSVTAEDGARVYIPGDRGGFVLQSSHDPNLNRLDTALRVFYPTGLLGNDAKTLLKDIAAACRANRINFLDLVREATGLSLQEDRNAQQCR